MKFALRTFEEIIIGTGKGDGFNDTKNILRGRHTVDDLSELEEPRNHQVQYIDKSRELLLDLKAKGDLYNPKEDGKILTGLIVIVLREIAAEYKETIFDALQPNSATRQGRNLGSGSTLFRSLLTNIGYDDEHNTFMLEDIRNLSQVAQSFLESIVHVESKSTKGFKNDHPYVSINGLRVGSYLTICAEIIYQASIGIVDRNTKKEEPLSNFKSQYWGSYFNFLGGANKVSNQESSTHYPQPKSRPRDNPLSGTPHKY